ncbi:hypothetical protein MPER_11472 [Moniliophthora perniciosa FA553]|nr:hypothetical protein MPER_11472 [Moniliophthora perniciosa FA553]
MYRLPRAVRAAPLLAAGVAATLSTPLDREKRPIYPQPDTEILVQEVPSELERQIGIARKSLTATYREAHGHVQGLVSRWIGVEQAVEHRVKSIISPEESLNPGILYVGREPFPSKRPRTCNVSIDVEDTTYLRNCKHISDAHPLIGEVRISQIGKDL